MLPEETVALDSARLNEALAQWERAREQGLPLRREDFLAEHPGIAKELAACLDAAEQVDRLAAPVRGALEGKPPLAVSVPEGYELLEELGRGGMGVVYRARQKGTEQLVALKLLRPDWLANLDEEGRQVAIEQFRVEAQAAARLRHPNRVRILHLGEQEGRPYYAMELIEGRSLADRLKDTDGVSTLAVVGYLASVAEAVQEAHDRGILHRDLKPHNILIDKHTDQALLADFGLALLAPGAFDAAPTENSVRHQARIVGTLPYMSPEQTRGADQATVQSDVYSLGATLYQALTGAPPFQGRSPNELIDKVRSEPPAALRQHNPRVNHQLERICLRCLEKAPQQRFPSARELAEALQQFLEDVRYTRHFPTTAGKRMLKLLPFLVVPHLLVFWLLLFRPLLEWLIWPLVFVEPVVRVATLSRTYLVRHRTRELQGAWPVWVSHLVAFFFLAVGLRATFPADPATVILFLYVVAAMLDGMAYFIEASKMHWSLRWGPLGFWLVGLLMLFHLPWAPLYYCAYTAFGTVAYALYLIKQGEELK